MTQTAAPNSARIAKSLRFSQVHPKPAFSEKVHRGDQGKFFKNRPKSSLRLKSPKALCRKWHYPQTTMLLRCKDWRRFWGKKAAPKVMAIFARSPKTRIFLKKCKRGPNRDFSKIAQKDALALKAQKHSGANGIIL